MTEQEPRPPSSAVGDESDASRSIAAEVEWSTGDRSHRPIDAESDGVSPQADVEVIDMETRETRSGLKATRKRPLGRSVAHTVGEAAMSLALRATRASFAAAGLAYRSVSGSAAGRLLADAARGAADSIAADGLVDWDLAERRAEEQLGRVIAVVAPVIVHAVDPEELVRLIDVDAIIAAIDVDGILASVDLDAVLQRVDVDRVLSAVDVNRFLDRVDVNALLERVDVNALLDRADVERLLARVDVDALLAEVDVDALLGRVDVNAVAKRAGIGELVAQSTGDVAGSALDLGRRQAVALDTLLARTVNRVLGRDSDTMPPGPPALTDSNEEAG
jgi:hypothetical protein